MIIQFRKKIALGISIPVLIVAVIYFASDKVMILLHGSGWHSQYFLPLAEFISSEGLAQVYTPDFRYR